MPFNFEGSKFAYGSGLEALSDVAPQLNEQPSMGCRRARLPRSERRFERGSKGRNPSHGLGSPKPKGSTKISLEKGPIIGAKRALNM